MVPALTWAARLPLRKAIGTSLAVIALSCLSGAVSHAIAGNVNPLLLATGGGGAAIGALVGAPLSGKLPEKPLRLAFALFAFALAVYMSTRVALDAWP